MHLAKSAAFGFFVLAATACASQGKRLPSGGNSGKGQLGQAPRVLKAGIKASVEFSMLSLQELHGRPESTSNATTNATTPLATATATTTATAVTTPYPFPFALPATEAAQEEADRTSPVPARCTHANPHRSATR